MGRSYSSPRKAKAETKSDLMISCRKSESPRNSPPYERLLPIIRDMSKFKWLVPIQTDASQRNKSLRCDYHRDHRHEIDKYRSLKFLVEKLIKAGHLRRYVREIYHGQGSGLTTDRIKAGATAPTKSRLAINYILGDPFDDQYQSKRQQKKLLRATIVKARGNAIHTKGGHKETMSIDGPISFPLVNPNRVIVPHYDALVLTLYINGFDVHRVLIDPGSAADLLQLPTFKHMKLSFSMINLAKRVLSGINGATTVTLGDVTLPMKDGQVT